MQILLIKIAVIVVFWSGGMFALNKIFGMILKRKEQIHIKFLRSMSKVVLTIIAFICISGLFNTTKALSATLLTSSSLLVAIVGFAAQQVLADVISGVMLSWSRPFNLGEKVNISSLGISGIVEDMTVRHTVIRTYHNSRMIIPNSVINKAIVENSNYNNDYIGNYMEVSVSYESNLEQAIEVMRETIASYPLVVDIRPDPSEEIRSMWRLRNWEMTESSLNPRSGLRTLTTILLPAAIYAASLRRILMPWVSPFHTGMSM